MGTVPSAYVPIAGRKITAVDLENGVTDVLNWLLNDHPRVHAWDASAASMANGSATLVPFNSETYDIDSMHDPAVFNSRIVHNTAGLYEEDWLITMVGGVAYTQLDLNIRLNAAGAAGGGTSLRTQPFSDGTRGQLGMGFRYQRFFNAGDYTEAFVTQTSGGARTLSATSLGTRCFSRWIAAS